MPSPPIDNPDEVAPRASHAALGVITPLNGLEQGRPISDDDLAIATRPAVVRERFARLHFWSGRAVGQRFRMGGRLADYEALGVARDAGIAGFAR